MSWINPAKNLANRASRIREDLLAILGDPPLQPTPDPEPLEPPSNKELLAAFDATITDADLRSVTRSRFLSEHYADAVESGVKALNELIRARTGRAEDGDELMTVAFSPKDPLLRVQAGQSKSAQSAQRGHMQLCQGVVAAWRNPRAHENLDDDPARVLVMLSTLQELMTVTRLATRTRKRRKV